MRCGLRGVPFHMCADLEVRCCFQPSDVVREIVVLAVWSFSVVFLVEVVFP